jgi:FkbM family methyltransferase
MRKALSQKHPKAKSSKLAKKKNLREKLAALQAQFKDGSLKRYAYITKKHEFNKLLLEYSSLIKDSSIERIEILPNALVFTIKPFNIQLEADGGARSAPFEILNFGSYEPEDESLVYRLIQNGDTVLDIGAHIGWYAINFAKRFPNCKIFCFEPIPFTFEILKSNIERNQVQNTSLHNYGLSNKDEERVFYYFKGGSALASIENLIGHHKTKKIRCKLRTLDKAIADLKIHHVDFIKADVEGAELFVFQGAEQTIKHFRPIIFTELYEGWCKKCGYSAADVLKFLKNLGYEAYQAVGMKLKKVKSLQLTDDERYNYFFLNKIKHDKLIKKFTL